MPTLRSSTPIIWVLPTNRARERERALIATIRCLLLRTGARTAKHWTTPSREFAPSTIVVALGLDTFAGDPTTNFDILAGDYITMGDRIATLSLPTLVVLEGGYAIDAIGENAANFLEGIAYRL